MSEVASKPADLPAPAPHEPIRALLRAGRNDEAIVKLCAITVTQPDDLAAKELLFDAFFQKRDWPPAHALVRELARRQPDNARLQRALIVTPSNMKSYDEAIAKAHEFIAQHGDDLTILDTLKVAHFYTGKIEDAVRYGQRGIELRDAEACSVPTTATLHEPALPPSGQNVISFSLWGPAPFYVTAR
jgi:tetratricopeptide (TPR) repeat protein